MGVYDSHKVLLSAKLTDGKIRQDDLYVGPHRSMQRPVEKGSLLTALGLMPRPEVPGPPLQSGFRYAADFFRPILPHVFV